MARSSREEKEEKREEYEKQRKGMEVNEWKGDGRK